MRHKTTAPRVSRAAEFVSWKGKDASMEILNLIAHLRGDARISELAEDLADASHAAVRERVSARLDALGIAEARGYIRARVAAVVRPAVDRLLASDSTLKRSWRTQLCERATEEVVRRLLWEEMDRRRSTLPARRAA